MGSYDAGSKTLVKAKNGDNYLAWKTGELHFEHAPVTDVLKDVGRYYGVSFLIKDSLLTKVSYTGQLNRQPFNAAIKILESSLGVHVTCDSVQHYSVKSD
jgi:transmembrane sensor